MPYCTEWTAPEVFLTHRGVTVYRTYKDLEWTNGPSTYWFTTCEDDAIEEFHFDVRSLPAWVSPQPQGVSADPEAIRTLLRLAINTGVLQSRHRLEGLAP